MYLRDVLHALDHVLGLGVAAVHGTASGVPRHPTSNTGGGGSGGGAPSHAACACTKRHGTVAPGVRRWGRGREVGEQSPEGKGEGDNKLMIISY